MQLDCSVLNKISKQYDRSFYLLNTKRFEDNYTELLNAFRVVYPNTHIAYSYKTNYIPKLCKSVNKLDGYAEVVSNMEYELAKRIGVKPDKVIFNGPYKPYDAVKEVLLGGGIVNIDSEYEFPMINSIAEEYPNITLNVGIRCNFDIHDGTISRFGFDVASDSFHNAVHLSNVHRNIHIVGLHCHFAARSLETWPLRTENMVSLILKYFEEAPEYVDFGGGLFGKMDNELKIQFDSCIPDYKEYANTIVSFAAQKFKGTIQPKLFIEPGSALVGDVMEFAAKVISIKNIRGKNIATLLGSIYNINPTLNKKNPPLYVLGNESGKYFENLDFGGFTCIESDYLYKGYSGKLSQDSYVVFKNIGSYSIVLKPPFILPNFPVIEYIEATDTIELVKRQETFDDIFGSYQF